MKKERERFVPAHNEGDGFDAHTLLKLEDGSLVIVDYTKVNGHIGNPDAIKGLIVTPVKLIKNGSSFVIRPKEKVLKIGIVADF